MRTSPDISATSPLHIDAAKDKDKGYLWAWAHARNVVDELKSLSNEDIKLRLEETAFPYAVLFENWSYDFNISTGIRNANAFNAKEVFYLGDKRFDRRGSQGCQAYMNISWVESMDEVAELKKRYTIVGVDNYKSAISIDKFVYPDNPLFVFGSEGVGITPTMFNLCDHLIQIPQFGSIRSLNVGTTSGIIMNDFVTKFNAKLI